MEGNDYSMVISCSLLNECLSQYLVIVHFRDFDWIDFLEGMFLN